MEWITMFAVGVVGVWLARLLIAVPLGMIIKDEPTKSELAIKSLESAM
jgi:hypothetical protein